jgi:hypothetical protein
MMVTMTVPNIVYTDFASWNDAGTAKLVSNYAQ